MKQFKKLIACVLAATLVLGSTTVFFGAESQTGNLGGDAELEGTVNKEVFSVVAPTIAATADVYDFKLDPEGLIETTSGNKYATGDVMTFVTYGSMYFKASADAYDVNSQKATIENKSSVDVTVTLNATVTVEASNAAITFDEDGVWAATDKSLGIYIGIKGEDKDAAPVTGAAIVANGGDFKGTVTTDLASYGAYSVQVSNGNYVYAIDDSKVGTTSAATYTFWLTGACNTNADWTDYDTNANPTINLVWTVEIKGAEEGGAEEGGEEVAAVTSVNNGQAFSWSKTSGANLPYTLANNVTITKIEIGANGSTWARALTENTDYTLSNDNIVLKTTLWSSATAGQERYIKVSFSAGEPIILKATIAN